MLRQYLYFLLVKKFKFSPLLLLYYRKRTLVRVTAQAYRYIIYFSSLHMVVIGKYFHTLIKNTSFHSQTDGISTFYLNNNNEQTY